MLIRLLKNSTRFLISWLNRRISDTIIIFVWVTLTGNWKASTWSFIILNNLIAIFLMGLCGVKVAVLWKIIPIWVAFFIWTTCKVSKKFDSFMCTYLKSHATPELFKSFCGNALFGVPELFAKLVGMGTGQKVGTVVLKTTSAATVAAGASVLYSEVVLKDVTGAYPAVEHASWKAYGWATGETVPPFDPPRRDDPRPESTVKQVACDIAKFIARGND